MLANSAPPNPRLCRRPQTAQPHKSPLPVVTGISVSEAFAAPPTTCSLSLAHLPRFQHSRTLRRMRLRSRGEAQETSLIVRPGRGKQDEAGSEKQRSKGTEDVEAKKSAFLTGISLGDTHSPPSPHFSLRRVKTLASMLPLKGRTGKDRDQWTCTWSNEVIRSCQTLDFRGVVPCSKRAFLRLGLGPK